ncbi:DUF2577 domain-containing protein [Lacrimispora amygdalina]|uniref:DUF2577 domain-containing protein n=1 Tax=Lacrimispora amygdalina TaxID=253257 RepID=A0A3E2NFY7_9FIRM|nr:DUF2577 family protein [Clostridium indicum]RFZ79853.1 DUF2577 domain-containing protein [Clostridium indicum]
MQEEGAKNNPPTIEFATMTGPKSCKIGDLLLVEEDLIFSEHLLNRLTIMVSVSESHSDQSQYIQPLQVGDEVAVIRVSQTRYLVLDRVVGL